jgi:hypothetical protein
MALSKGGGSQSTKKPEHDYAISVEKRLGHGKSSREHPMTFSLAKRFSRDPTSNHRNLLSKLAENPL